MRIVQGKLHYGQSYAIFKLTEKYIKQIKEVQNRVLNTLSSTDIT